MALPRITAQMTGKPKGIQMTGKPKGKPKKSANGRPKARKGTQSKRRSR